MDDKDRDGGSSTSQFYTEPASLPLETHSIAERADRRREECVGAGFSTRGWHARYPHGGSSRFLFRGSAFRRSDAATRLRRFPRRIPDKVRPRDSLHGPHGRKFRGPRRPDDGSAHPQNPESAVRLADWPGGRRYHRSDKSCPQVRRRL